jgi:hypothetical protein
MAKHRSITLELTKEKEPILLTHCQDDFAIIRDFHQALRETIEKRGSTILYSAIIDLDTSRDCGCH